MWSRTYIDVRKQTEIQRRAADGLWPKLRFNLRVKAKRVPHEQRSLFSTSVSVPANCCRGQSSSLEGSIRECVTEMTAAITNCGHEGCSWQTSLALSLAQVMHGQLPWSEAPEHQPKSCSSGLIKTELKTCCTDLGWEEHSQ